jgi:hypothetical protein
MNGALDRFLLQDALALTKKLGDSERGEVKIARESAREKLDAAKLLWASDHFAEALRLAEASLEQGIAAAAALADHADDKADARDAPWVKTLRWLGAKTEEVETIRAAHAVTSAEALPARNRDFREGHVGRYEGAARAALNLERRLGQLCASPRELALMRTGRIAVAALAVVTLATVLYFGLRVDPTIHVTASSSFEDAKFQPTSAIDGNPATEWLLPTRAQGFLELRFAARKVKRVTVRNAHNFPFEDRATRDFTVETSLGGKVVHSSRHSFATFESKPMPMTLPVSGAAVDAVKIVVESFHKSGGGLAEVTLD